MERVNAAAAVLDRVDPHEYDGYQPLFDDEQMKSLAADPDPAGTLLAIVRDDNAPLARRYAAIEAARQGGWAAPLARDGADRVTARVLGAALPLDTSHNRWGLPGQNAGPMGTLLLGLRSGVREALLPLLSDDRELNFYGSHAPTLQAAHRYRVSDLASYLLARHEGVAWVDAPDAATRDENIRRLER